MQATFPYLALRQTAQFYPVGMSMEAQESVSGAPMVVPTMRARWNASVSLVLQDEPAVLQWRAFLLQMQGRVGTTLVPAFSRWRPRDRDGHGLRMCDTASIADAQAWEHFGFRNAEISRITVRNAASLRATRIDLTLVNTTGIRPGQFFSIGDRLHAVQQHWQPDANTHRVMIWPPLRESVAAGTAVEIEKPVCKMRMTTETEGLFDISMDVLPTVQVQFEEAL